MFRAKILVAVVVRLELGSRLPLFTDCLEGVFSETGSQKTRNAKNTASATHINHTATTTNAPTRLTGFSPSVISRAFSRHSANTSEGIIFIVMKTPKGTTTISSSNPTTGMKSGIGSIGLKTYPTTRAAKTFAYQGVLG